MNYIHGKVCDEITDPFSSFTGVTIEVWEWISNFTPRSILCLRNYLSMLGFKLNHVSKKGYMWQISQRNPLVTFPNLRQIVFLIQNWHFP